MAQQLVIISNRLPVTVKKTNGKLEFSFSAGGLATAMSSVRKDYAGDFLWIGWPGVANDLLTDEDRAFITKELRKDNFLPVFLSEEQVQDFYSGYSNGTLWPLFHYFPQITEYENTYWEGYQAVNELFKETVVANIKPDAQIWVHDYHLMLLPKLLRQELPESSIGFFLHIPFPSYELFRLLPNGNRLLHGLLGADLVGFHTYDYVRHFQSSVLHALGYETSPGIVHVKDRIVRTEAFPIGIDYEKYVNGPKQEVIKQQIMDLEELFPDQQIIFSVDRVDYSKGIVTRLQAFGLFLEKYPQYRQKVVMIMIASPSRTDVEAYQKLREEIEVTVSRINGLYSTMEWTPISYRYQTLPFEELSPLFYFADVCLVTPLRDGMNLVAKEYVATQTNYKGVLVLSEMTGVVHEMPEAIIVKPNSLDSMADAMKEALEMPPAEKKRRLKAMQARLSKNDIRRWTTDMMNDLKDAKTKQLERSNRTMSTTDKGNVLEAYKKAKKRLLLLDYDGTMMDFVKSPDPRDAKPTKELYQLLRNLQKPARNQTAIISGRTKAALDGWFKKDDFILIAEHGGWSRLDGKWRHNQINFKPWKAKLLPLLHQYADRTPGAKVEEKDYSLVWHYRWVPAEQAYARNTALRHELLGIVEGSDIGIYSGNKIIEIKPQTIGKGFAVERLYEDAKPDFTLCIGDDYTDEDMFRSLPSKPDIYTIKVGLDDSHANYHLASVEDVLGLLEALAASD